MSGHRLLVLAAAFGAGCGSSTPAERRVVPHAIVGCEMAQNRGLLLTALGDFATRAVGVTDPRGSAEVGLPGDLLGVEAQSSPAGWLGVGYAAPPDDVHFALWPSARACDASGGAAPVPPSAGGLAMTAYAGGSAVLVAGLAPAAGGPVNDAAFALAWDTRAGGRLPLGGMGAHRRAFATATPFGDGALVAGGIDPRDGRPTDEALVLEGSAFQEPPIPLGDARARHGAVVLANGETLLVGGEAENGALFPSLVAVAPSAGPERGRARLYGLATLIKPRKDPAVLRLANDEILVAGGLDGDGAPVAALEWIAEDGTPCDPERCAAYPRAIPARLDRAFAPLAAGGALAVGGVDPSSGELALDAHWITHEGARALVPLTARQRGQRRALRLVTAADGAPWLWNGDAWLRFDPWQAAFVTPDAAPETGPDEDLPLVAVDAGLFMWLAREAPGDPASAARLFGFRHGVRGPLSHDTDFYLVAPRHVAPESPPGDAIRIERDGVALSGGARIVVTDTRYAGAILVGELAARGPLPDVWFGAIAVGGDLCPWPAPRGAAFRIERRGTEIRASVDGGTPATCAGPEGRVAIGLAGREPVTVRRLAIARQ